MFVSSLERFASSRGVGGGIGLAIELVTIPTALPARDHENDTLNARITVSTGLRARPLTTGCVTYVW